MQILYFVTPEDPCILLRSSRKQKTTKPMRTAGNATKVDFRGTLCFFHLQDDEVERVNYLASNILNNCVVNM